MDQATALKRLHTLRGHITPMHLVEDELAKSTFSLGKLILYVS